MSDNLNIVQKIFCAIGILATMVIVAAIVAYGLVMVQEKIKDIRHAYRWKHRFDGKPTAKCWCIDCDWYRTDGRCDLPGVSRYPGENGFCHLATPRKRNDGIRVGQEEE